jgi:hypothetical protein
MDVLYRLSTNSGDKPKFPNATKERCLVNALNSFPDAGFHLFVDRTKLTDDGRRFAERVQRAYGIQSFHTHDGGSSTGSWKVVFEYALLTPGLDRVYFLEDDYLHLPNSAEIMEEGLSIADYASLYDHLDKYIPSGRGGNPYIGEDGGEKTKVFRTTSAHWKLSNSTTMTFATTVAQLRKDEGIWRKHTMIEPYPNDFQCFLELGRMGRSLVTSIPGYSTHCEPQWASPGINWAGI